MAANTSQTTKSTDLPERPCTGYSKEHPAHAWESHVLQKKAWCDGNRLTWEEYAEKTGFGKTSTFKKTDYVKDTREDGRPWRADYTKPLTVREARAIAYHMHRNDQDKSGEPYHLHLHAVQQGVVILGGDHEEQIAALFHDAVEDFHTTYRHLQEIGCTPRTLVIIEAVSKRTSEEQNMYLNRILNAGKQVPTSLKDLGITPESPGMEEAAEGAMRTKAADLLHNLRHDRMKQVKKIKGEYTHDRLLKKYRPFLARLMMELSLIVDHDEQKKIATKPQGSSTGGYTYSGGKSYSSTSYGSQGFSTNVKGLLLGDWPTAWEAPIANAEHGDGKSTFTLANGEVKADVPWKIGSSDRKMHIYSYNAWSTSSTIQPHKAATDDDIADYINVIEAAKAARDSKDSDLTPLWGDEDLAGWAGI